MIDLLDKIENQLEDVEDQLLSEFERIRKTLTGEQYSPIHAGLKNTLDEIVMGLWHDLEQISHEGELTLRTEQQENISIRMIVIKKLLDAKIPTAFLTEAQEQIEKSRMEASPGDEDVQAEVTVEEHVGFLETIKRFFRGKPSNDASGSITGAEETEKEPIGIYLDSVYAASQHLAALAARFQINGNARDMMNAVASGKAVFESKELTTIMSEIPESESADTKARSPEEIRRKLEGSNRQPGGTSKFDSRELSSTIPGPVRQKEIVAQTPDEIRKKLETRYEDSSSSGKASFGSKDMEQVSPPKEPMPRKAEKTPEEPPKGKAVFGSKNLSSQD